MKIAVDVSQLAFENTGVSNYLKNLIQALIRVDSKNDYILFFSSLRKNFPQDLNLPAKVKVKTFRLPPTVLDILWNKLHILPIENFIGPVDVFITSDWTEPPARKAKKATILYKYPEETHNKIGFNPLKLLISPNIVASQKRKLKWAIKESSKILCISESTAKDAEEILGIDKNKLEVIYAGI